MLRLLYGLLYIYVNIYGKRVDDSNLMEHVCICMYTTSGFLQSSGTIAAKIWMYYLQNQTNL